MFDGEDDGDVDDGTISTAGSIHKDGCWRSCGGNFAKMDANSFSKCLTSPSS